ncbi:MAG: sigma-54 dependent transcriptional regulator [Planctomycetota bacterium]
MPYALIIEDDAASLGALAELVRQESFEIETALSLAEARARLAERRPDVVLMDLLLPDGNSISLVKELQAADCSDIILITGHASVDSAVEALRCGITDYLTKPIDIGRLIAALKSAARTRELRGEIDTLRDQLRHLGRFGALIGASPAMQRVYDMIARVAPTDAAVLLIGESGTGKDVVAQTIQQLSRRRKEAFLPLNCGAVSPTLIESELFGHERGSFTGAARTHRGYFERASGGTLFLDEITEMAVELQVKLLRVLETGTVHRIGSTEAVPVDVRVIAATNRTPEEAMAAGKLREDLLYRLAVFPMQLPPLRDRAGDVALLAEHFLAQLNHQEGTTKAFAHGIMEMLNEHAWPGNVRELKNAVHRAFILADGEILLEDLMRVTPHAAVPAVAEPQPASPLEMRVGMSIADAERQLILSTLHANGRNMKRTAAMLGISLKTLYNRLTEYRRTGVQEGLAPAPELDESESRQA